MTRILIADDHAIFRKGLKQIISEMSIKAVIDEACDGQEALNKAWTNDYNVVLLDITMPGRNGIDVLKQLKINKPEQKVLIMSVYAEAQFGIRALRAGADGYLQKTITPDQFIDAIRTILTGGKHISSSLAQTLVNHVSSHDNKPLHETLSDREYEVMRMIASGKTSTEIAENLSLSKQTVSTYRSRILSKMKMNNNSEIMHYTIHNRLTELCN